MDRATITRERPDHEYTKLVSLLENHNFSILNNFIENSCLTWDYKRLAKLLKYKIYDLMEWNHNVLADWRSLPNCKGFYDKIIEHTCFRIGSIAHYFKDGQFKPGAKIGLLYMIMHTHKLIKIINTTKIPVHKIAEQLNMLYSDGAPIARIENDPITDKLNISISDKKHIIDLYGPERNILVIYQRIFAFDYDPRFSHIIKHGIIVFRQFDYCFISLKMQFIVSFALNLDHSIHSFRKFRILFYRKLQMINRQIKEDLFMVQSKLTTLL